MSTKSEKPTRYQDQAAPRITLSQTECQQRELFCDLNLEKAAKKLGHNHVPISLLSRKVQYLEDLKAAYEEGGQDYTRDLVKAEQYKTIAEALKPKNTQWQADPFIQDDVAPQKTVQPAPRSRLAKFKNTHVHTATIHKNTDRVNLLRLLLVRLNLFLITLKHPIFGRLLAIAGFIYGARLVSDIAIVLYTTFRPGETDTERFLSHKQRFLNVLTKDNRINRMINDIVWFPVNLIAFFIPGASKTVTMIGAFVDIKMEFKKFIEQIRALRSEKKKVADKIAIQEKKLSTLTAEAEKEGAEQELLGLRIQAEALREQLSSICWKRAYDTITCILTVVGMALFFFPPTSFLGLPVMYIPTIAAGMVLVFGSIANGFCKYVVENVVDYLKYTLAEPAKESVKHAIPNSQTKMKLVFANKQQVEVIKPKTMQEKLGSLGDDLIKIEAKLLKELDMPIQDAGDAPKIRFFVNETCFNAKKAKAIALQKKTEQPISSSVVCKST